jgi:hypothetical protein
MRAPPSCGPREGESEERDRERPVLRIFIERGVMVVGLRSTLAGGVAAMQDFIHAIVGGRLSDYARRPRLRLCAVCCVSLLSSVNSADTCVSVMGLLSLGELAMGGNGAVAAHSRFRCGVCVIGGR